MSSYIISVPSQMPFRFFSLNFIVVISSLPAELELTAWATTIKHDQKSSTQDWGSPSSLETSSSYQPLHQSPHSVDYSPESQNGR